MSEKAPLNRNEAGSKPMKPVQYVTDVCEPTVRRKASLIKESQQQRSKSALKWHVLGWMTTMWVAGYHCFYSVSAMENSLMDEFNLDNTQFSLLMTSAFAFALVGALVTPLIVNRYNLYIAMMSGQLAAVVGQSLFFVGVLYGNSNLEMAFLLMYIGRLLVGFSVGVDEVVVLSITTLWFGESKWSSLAVMVVCGTFELGAITCRYILIPFLDVTGLPLAYAFSVGIGISAIASISAVFVICLERRFERDMESKGIQVQRFTMDHNFLKVFWNDPNSRDESFSLELWLVIVYCQLSVAIILTYVAEMTDPFMVKYGFTEWTSDFVLSCCSVGNLITAPIWGWIVGKYGGLVYYQIGGILAMALSCALYSWVPKQFYPDVMPWVTITLFILATELSFVSAFESTYALCPKNLIAIATSINSIGYLIGSISTSVAFGAIADVWNYNWSVAMLFAVSIVAAIIAVLTWIIDIRDNGPLHKCKCGDGVSPKYDSPLYTGKANDSPAL